MSEEIKKIEKIADEAQATELTVDDLEQTSGGISNPRPSSNKEVKQLNKLLGSGF